ncbi:Oleosin 1-like [Castilleja foliolosa]|uniref:Oleosin n=1 Tax=Castilleja foliolosa TaxID=1961234 RepID=A0ABD3E374_9LAMI
MAEHYTQQHQQGIMRPHQQPQHHSTTPLTHQVVKAATAATAGGSLLVLSGLTLAGTVIALTIATPLLVIFSPVLVPAVITMFMLGTGFLASGGFGVAALSVLSWMYRYMTGKHPMGADQLDTARMKLGSKAREMKEKGEQFGHQNVTTGTHQTS